MPCCLLTIFFRCCTIQVTKNERSGHLEADMSIFTLEKRTEVQKKLLEVGVALIREKGIVKMTISEVTARTGIGKGTFYHFYAAKEYYVYDVIQYSKDKLKLALNDILEENGCFHRESLGRFLSEFSFYSKNNIVNSISAEDENWLREHLPPEYVLNVPREEEIVASILEKCRHTSPKPDSHIIANLMKIMALAVENKAILHEDVLDENLNMLSELLLDYIFGSEQSV